MWIFDDLSLMEESKVSTGEQKISKRPPAPKVYERSAFDAFMDDQRDEIP